MQERMIARTNQNVPYYVMRVYYHCGNVRTLRFKDYGFMMDRYNAYINRELVNYITASYFDGEYYSEIPLHATAW